MPIEPGATYVFDLGYYDFGWWAKLDEAGCRIVTRFKSQYAACTCRSSSRSQAGRPSCPTASAFCPRAMAEAAITPSAIRCARSASDRHRQGLAHPHQRSRCHRRTRSPTSTSAAGRSNCSSAGSSRRSRSATSSAPPRTPCASRSPSPSSPSCSCARQAAQKPSKPARLRPPRARQPHAPTDRSPPPPAARPPIICDPRQLALRLNPT